MNITLTNKIARNDHLILIADKDTDWSKIEQPEENIDIIKSQIKKDIKQIVIPSPTRMVFISMIDKKENKFQTDELIRKAGNKIFGTLSKHKIAAVTIQNYSSVEDAPLNYAEGIALSSYQFIQFKKDAEKESNSLKEIRFYGEGISKRDVETLQT